MRIHNWATRNRLEYLYAPGSMPAKIVQAIDLIDYENSKIMSAKMEANK